MRIIYGQLKRPACLSISLMGVFLLAACGASSSSSQDPVQQTNLDASASPTPAPTIIDGYTVGPLVADMYNDHAFCYGYNQTNNSCSSRETVSSRSADKIQVVNEAYGYRKKDSPNTFGDLVVDGITSGTTLNPNGLYIQDTQTWSITPEGLCRTRQQETQDAYSLNMRYMSAFDGTGKLTELENGLLERVRNSMADRVNGEIGKIVCWRFIADAADPSTITGNKFIDGIKQTETSVIHIADNNGKSLTLRPQ